MTAALPDHAYIPGQTARHPQGRFDALRATATDPTASATAACNPAFQAGLDFLEAGFFWEAHEVLEPVWMNAPANSAERFLVQALIQLANAALKHAMDRPNAALRLCAIAADLLRRAGPPDARVMGLAAAAAGAAIEELARAAAAGRPAAVRVRPDPDG